MYVRDVHTAGVLPFFIAQLKISKKQTRRAMQANSSYYAHVCPSETECHARRHAGHESRGRLLHINALLPKF